MSGQWWESDLIVGPFANITEANAWAAANPSSLFLGLLATSNGQQISWGGAGVGWVSNTTIALDGKIWDTRASAADNGWRSICLHTPTGRLVAVADGGTGNRVMTSGGW